LEQVGTDEGAENTEIFTKITLTLFPGPLRKGAGEVAPGYSCTTWQNITRKISQSVAQK